jgi:hypothetical protein
MVSHQQDWFDRVLEQAKQYSWLALVEVCLGLPRNHLDHSLVL